MKSFLVLVACSMLIFSGCERHPVAQWQEINARSEINPEKGGMKAEGESGGPQNGQAVKANPSPRAYFPADTK